MAKIWVHIETAITPADDATKAVLTDSLNESISAALVERITGALPADKFSTANKDKPIKATDAYNALKIVADLNLKVATQGSKMSVTCDLKVTIEAIRAPITKPGSLLGSGGKGVTVERRGSGERGISGHTNECLDHIAAPLVKQIINHDTFKSYAKKLGLPL